MKIRRKIRPPKTRSAVLGEYDFKYAKIVVDTRGALNKFLKQDTDESYKAYLKAQKNYLKA